MKQKRQLIKIFLAAVLFAGGIFLNGYLSVGLFIIAYFMVGYDVIIKSLKNIIKGNVFDENFLMSIATFGAFALGQYSEAVGVMLFYQIGELFQSYAVNKSRRSVAALMDIRPDYANLKCGNDIKIISPEEVKLGEIIIIKSGERIPLDGVIVSGVSMVDTSAITGESVPQELSVGDEILSGCININGLLEVRVSKKFEQSTVAKILDLVENAGNKKAKVEQFITKFARYYTPFVVISALLIAFIPPLFIDGELLRDWVYRAFILLVISCPCALVISVPLSFFGGIGAASRKGILVKGSNYLQALSETEIVVFDKTGTLTKGTFKVIDVYGADDKSEVIDYAAHAGAHSSHPVSQSIRNNLNKAIDLSRVGGFEEIPASGIKAKVDGKEVYVGNARLLNNIGIAYPQTDLVGTVVYVVVDKQLLGWVLIADEIKPDAKTAIEKLKALGVRQTVMLTGDRDNVGQEVASKLGIDKVFTEQLPAQKVENVEKLMQQKSAKGKLVFVGDGINDAPVLARADIGIAMGGVGSDAAVEAADIVIMTDEPSKISTAIKISQKTLRIVKQNIVFALGVKFAVLGLGAIGMATMWEAIFADVGVSVIAILNAVRALRVKG